MTVVIPVDLLEPSFLSVEIAVIAPRFFNLLMCITYVLH
ncbi:conserved hypothetical protein [Vibrio crassostreae]|nr:conserved hypothetical protein [Vibrio crassostreae]CAK2501172.1 conserved hypothetical protein [Vibrio crassostreae]CAK3660809.1 conserved hypothetical protein [Vibrio crassostreae]